MLSQTDFISSLKEVIAEKHLLNHPFYQMWAAGTLPMEAMQRYAEQYYHLEVNFPRFLSRMHAGCENFAVRQAITENLYDEEHGSENHRELWLRFGEGIGTTRESMISSYPLVETQAAVNTFLQLSSESFLSGVGALSAYESQVPEVVQSKISGLQKNYNVSDENTLKFFRVHAGLDVEHANTWWNIIAEHAVTEEQQNEVRDAVVFGRDVLYGFLDGVCREYVPEACVM